MLPASKQVFGHLNSLIDESEDDATEINITPTSRAFSKDLDQKIRMKHFPDLARNPYEGANQSEPRVNGER
jgi:hypothetical protein